MAFNSTPNESSSNAGAAYVFHRIGLTWTHQAYLKASNTGSDDYFGWSVTISGDTVVVGARQEDSSTTGIDTTPNESATDSGAAYVFFRNASIWAQQAYLKASNTGPSDLFGHSVSINGDTLVEGAYGEDSSATGINGSQSDNLTPDSGAAYVFVRNGTTWTHQIYLKAFDPGLDDYFGYSVTTSGDTIVVGAIFENSSTAGINSPPNEAAPDSGASYIFGPDVVQLAVTSVPCGGPR